MDEDNIEELKVLCFNLGQYIMFSSDLNANTKLCTLMRYVSDQVKEYGSMIWSTNDLNEFIHKETKHSFGITNKRPNLDQ